MNKLKKEVSYVSLYRKKMENIPFMEPYINDIPDIFDVSSSKSTEFLTSCFTFLNSYFHYLSFLNSNDTKKELLKAAQILNIHPHPRYPIQFSLFDGLDLSEQHKFWMRLFHQFDIKNKKREDDFLKMYDSYQKFKKIANIDDALSYFNYKFPTLTTANLKNIHLNSEIEKWKTLSPPDEIPENNLVDLSIMIEVQDVDISKPIEDVKYLTLKHDLPQIQTHENFNDYDEFFKKFNIAAENVINYKENMKVIQSFIENAMLKKLREQDSDFVLPNINQVKKCHELVKKIKRRRKDLISNTGTISGLQ